MPATSQSKSEPYSVPQKDLARVLDVIGTLNVECQLPELLGLITKETAKFLEADSTSILIYDQTRCELVAFVTLDGVPIHFDARLGIAGAALSSGEVINVRNAQEDHRFFPGVDRITKKRTRTLLAIPICCKEGPTVGVFEAMNKKNGPFTRRDIELVSYLLEHIGPTVKMAHILHLVSQQRDQLSYENSKLWKEMEGRFLTQNLIGTSPRIQNIIRLIDQIGDSSVDVLISGENGTGKELVAKAIHYNSLRARKPFVAFNCAALPENLVESEMFGIEKGVATGVDARIGKFEQAHQGTLFLDEIGDLGKPAQAKILRVLQERVLERVGGRTAIPIDVRVIAATNKHLEKGIEDGTFREDLYYRLKIIQIETPALREIPEDIPMLAHYFLDKHCREMRKEPKRISPSAMTRLEAYVWPGNVRHLENEIKRLVVTVRRPNIGVDDLEENIRSGKVFQGNALRRTGKTIHDAVKTLEQQMILDALQVCRYNQVQTAKMLGLSRQGLIKKMKRYGITES